MKRILTILGIIVVVLVLAFFALRSFTKASSPEAVAQVSQNGLNVTVNYCRPYRRNRKIFGGLVPYGQVWRTGANEATVIDVNQNVTVAGQPLKAGKYSFWTIPSQAGWIAIFNGETGQWGTDYDQKKDVLRVPMSVRQSNAMVEQFLIEFIPQSDAVDMVLSWEQTQAVLPIRKQ